MQQPAPTGMPENTSCCLINNMEWLARPPAKIDPLRHAASRGRRKGMREIRHETTWRTRAISRSAPPAHKGH